MYNNTILKYAHSYTVIAAFCILFCTEGLCQSGAAADKIWVGTWSTAPQLVESANMPPSPGLTNNALRQVMRVSIGGDTLRVRFSNTFSTSQVVMKSVQVAVSTGGSTVNSATSKNLAFNGSAQVTMNAGSMVVSDPIAFSLKPRMDVTITISYGQTSSSVTGHPGSRTTSYLLSGTATPTTDFKSAATTEHWYNIFAIEVRAASSSASVAILGNSITDGRGSTTDKQNRWADILSERLVANPETQEVGILNMGIGGNNVLKDGLGPSGVSRFERDILNQPGVRLAIIGEGVNDIGGVGNASAATSVANSLIAAFKQMITATHAKNIKVYGATIMPFKGNSYYNQYSESCRTKVNEWIRSSGLFDAVIDFDKTMQSKSDPLKLDATFQNDGLHPDAAGYKKMGESIDLNLFKGLGMVSGVTDESNSTGQHMLSQNNPNPFNEKTSIAFHLPGNAFVSLKVYSPMGKEITELAGKEFSSGANAVEFDGANLEKGIYFYSIKTDTYAETRKMMLLGK